MPTSHSLFVSVDMDEWYMASWACGYSHSSFKTREELFKSVYGRNEPRCEIKQPTEMILKLFQKLRFKSTFFFTGYIASLYPELVKMIADEGHEIGCHNMEHINYAEFPIQKFKDGLKKSKDMLEDISGRAIVGYRAPNSSIPLEMGQILQETGFLYDSSVTPARSVFWKFKGAKEAPSKPYHPSGTNIFKRGNLELMELPLAIFPWLKLPAGSGVMHRIAGNVYNNIALFYALKRWSTGYYFHPFEIVRSDKIDTVPRSHMAGIYCKNMGATYFKHLKNMLAAKQEYLINGRELVQKFKQKELKAV